MGLLDAEIVNRSDMQVAYNPVVPRRSLDFFLLLALGSALALPAVAQDPDAYLRQEPGKNSPGDLTDWRKREYRQGLKPYPDAPPSTPNPEGGVSQFGGRAKDSFSTPRLAVPFAEWTAKLKAMRPEVDRAARRVLEEHYNLDCVSDPAATMSRGKPLAVGPTARLPQGASSWEQYAALPASEIRERGDFPYPPLDHPLHSTAHMLFPDAWTAAHPEHERMDVGMDIPDCFLPEFPPAMYLTTHLELGDVTRGVEVAYGNYFEIFRGLLTPEQMEGLRLLVTPFQSTWFNVSDHRVTEAPSQGVSCFSCHVNGHTNGAIELAPDSRPTTVGCARIRRPCAGITPN